MLVIALSASAASSLVAQEPVIQQRRSQGRLTTASFSNDTRVYDVVSLPGAREVETFVRRRVGDEWLVTLSATGNSTELRFDTLFNMRAYRHAATGVVETAVRLDGDRLRGSAPDASGRARAVDHAAPMMVGPRLLWLALIEAMPTLPERKLTLPEMDLSGDGTPRTLSLRMQGTEPLTVPAGTFTAVRIATDDGAVYWVREQAPHVLLRLELPALTRLGGTGASRGARTTYELRSATTVSDASAALSASAAPLLSRLMPGFEVHAPDTASLTVATAGAARAAAHFTRLFHRTPAPFATVLFDTEAQRLAHNDAQYRARGLHVRRWRARSIEATEPVVAVPLEALGVVARVDAGGELRVIGVMAGGAGAAAGLGAGDVVTGWNGEAVSGAAGAARVRALVRALRPGDTTTLVVARAGATTTMALQAAGVTEQVRNELQGLMLGAAKTTPISEAFVAHETVHQLVAHHVGQLPAWFNEGIAAFVETTEEFAPQHAALRRYRDEFIPFRELFASAHPAAAGNVVSSDTPSGDGGVRIIQNISDPAVARRTALFYPQSRSVVEFLLAREGSDAVRRVAYALQAGRPMAAIVAEMQHVPRELEAFEREWAEWARARLGQ